MDMTPSATERSGSILHVGCGNEHMSEGMFADYTEVRLDIDPNCNPDIVASMTDMGEIGPFDLVYASHCLEHLAPADVMVALGECLRVLRPGGAVLFFVPDLEGVPMTEDVLYVSPAGPICGLDLMYGLRHCLHLMPYMAHLTAFTRDTLAAALESAGFDRVYVKRIECYNLIAGAVKP